MASDSFLILPLLVLPLVIGIFIWFFLRKDRQHAAEAGKTPVFSETCAGVVGWVGYKGPFIRLAVYENFMVLSCDRQYYLPFSDIIRIERRSFLFRKGYRLHHKNSQYPKHLEVWLNGRDKFEAAVAGKVSLT